jgi:dipeptidyl-peptidase-4
MRAPITDQRDHFSGGFDEVGPPEAVLPIVAGNAHHPGIAEAPITTKAHVIGDAENRHGVGKFDRAVRAERVVMVNIEVLEFRNQHLALFAERARDERDALALTDVARHRHPTADGFVIGVGVNEHQATALFHVGNPTARDPKWQDRDVTATRAERTASFPRRSAATRGFRLGAPRSFTLSPDGRRVVFLRSANGDDPVNRLWVLDVATGEERCVLDPLDLGSDDSDLPPEERARRERVREVAGGVVTYATDRAVETAVVALGSITVMVDLRSGRVDRLPLKGAVLDVRLDPTARRVAFVQDSGLWIYDVTGMASTAPVRLTPDEETDTVTWGLAEFVAAEEMDRTRGFWWSPDGSAMLVARVDNAPVATWWIADPAHPEREPVAQRYPAAGTANAEVSLHLIELTGRVTPIAWDHAAFEYLTTAGWDDDGPWVQVQSRDQRDLAVLAIAADGSTSVEHQVHDGTWVELVPGVPARHNGRLVQVHDDPTCDTRRLMIDGAFLSPVDLQIRAVADIDDAGILVVASSTQVSAAQSLHLVSWDGSIERIGAAGGWVTGRRRDGTTLLVEQDAASTASTVTVRGADGTGRIIESFAETPGVQPRPHQVALPDRRMRVAVLFPSHDDGRTAWPVLMDPYGGPHGQRVAAAGAAFTTAQWWADQGFAVIVADGRGTPGTPAWEKAVHGDLAHGVLDDQVTALEAVADAFPDRIDSGRVGIRGWSFGGYLAALAVLDRPDVFHAAVAGAPVTDWTLYDTHYTERYLGRPGIDGGDQRYAANSLIDRAPALTRPLMLIHGLADDNVVAAHTLRLSSALLAAGRAHEVLPLSGVTHMTPQEVVAENLLLLQRDFLHRHLP